MEDHVLHISVTDFKAKCLALFDDLVARRLDRIVVLRRGQAVAELTPPRVDVPSLWGAHRGSVEFTDADLTAPALDEPLDAEHGVLHR